MSKCQISWIDRSGEPTPDNNDAIGVVYREEYWFDAGPVGLVKLDQTRCFNVCLDHVMRMNEEPMTHWHFVPFPLFVSGPEEDDELNEDTIPDDTLAPYDDETSTGDQDSDDY